MIDLDKEGPAALIRYLGECLTAKGVEYETDSTGTIVALVGETSAGPCGGVITAERVETEENMNLLQVGFALPFEEILEERLPALYELLALLGPHLVIGLLEIEHEEMELRWRAHQLLPFGPPWNETRLMALPLEGIDTIERLFGTIAKVVVEGDDPNVAVAEMLLDTRQEVPGPYETEILRLLKVARRRLLTTDTLALERVSGLLLRLAE